MKKGAKRFLSLFLSLVMLISVVPIFEIEAFAGTKIVLQEYYSTNSRKIAGSPTGHSAVFKATDKEGRKGVANLNNCIFETVKNTLGDKTYNFRITEDVIMSLKSDENEEEFDCHITYEKNHFGDFNYIVKIDSIKVPKGSHGNSQIIERTYFKRKLSDEGKSNKDKIKDNIKNGGSSAGYANQNIPVDPSTGSNGMCVGLLTGITSLFKPMTVYAASRVVIPKNTRLVVERLSADEKNGLVTYQGNKYWVNLNYITYVAPALTKPVAPTVTLNSDKDIPISGFMTFSWNSVVDAHYYSCSFYNDKGECVKTFDNIYGTTCTWSTDVPGTYTAKVVGKNSMYTGDTGTCGSKVVVHGQSDVTYVDEDGTILSKQKAHFKESVTAPVSPTKIGYTFDGWDGSLSSITKDVTFRAKYRINEYTVQFKDYTGKVVSEQKVKYQHDATPPTSVTTPKNYSFIGWDSEKYKNVYSYDVSKPIVINALYDWTNKDLPVECELKSAVRYSEGYEIHFKFTNYPNDITIGRAVVALKTSTGKLITTTESAAFRLDEGETKNDMYVFVPCEEAATIADVMVIDSYTSGVPISNLTTTSSIDNSKRWSKWLTEDKYQELINNGTITSDDSTVESKQEYKFIDARTTTYSSNKYGDWTYRGTYSSSLGSYSGWQDSPISAVPFTLGNSYSRAVETRRVQYVASTTTHYEYYHWHSSSGYNNSYQYNSTYKYHSISLTYPLSYVFTGSTGINWYGYSSCPSCGLDKYWIPNGTWVSNNYADKTQYRYRDTYYWYNFYRYEDSDWSNWSDVAPASKDLRKIENRTVYRYQSTSAGVEDNSGEVRTFAGTIDLNTMSAGTEAQPAKYIYYRYYNPETKYSKPVPDDGFEYSEISLDSPLSYAGTSSIGAVAMYRYNNQNYYLKEVVSGKPFAGKNVTMFISKYDESSDFTNEYVGQTTVNENGEYIFNYKLREEPTEKTGDFIISIGVEGTTGMKQVGIIEAPKPKFTVEYVDYDGNLISSQIVTQGENATIPSQIPERKGYTFVSWNTPPTNIQKNYTGSEAIKPIYTKNKFTVIYVNWNNQTVTSKEYEYGDVLESVKFDGTTESDVVIDDDSFIDSEAREEYLKEEMIGKQDSDTQNSEIIESEFAANSVELTDEDVIDDEYESKTGYAVGWDALLESEDEVHVTSDMVVSAVYETKTYNVDFYDYEGNIIDSQTVEHGGAVEVPDLPTDDGIVYDNWDIDEENLFNIKGDLAVFPSFEFSEDTSTPVASVCDGAYASTQRVTLSCDDENAVIYYTTNGENPVDSFETMEYTAPITISSSTVLKFYSTSFNKNPSPVVENYYAIGNTDKLVTVHDTLDEEIEYKLIVNSMSSIDASDFDNNYGYTIQGLYNDSACTQAMSTKDSDYTQIVDLYAKFKANTYTVRFFDSEDSTTPIQTTKVEYGSKITPPEMEDKRGLVFTGWDVDDLEDVLEDMDVHAIYKRPEEIASVTFDKSYFSAEQGVNFDIKATVTNSDLDLIWYSDNSDVALVDDSGNVATVGVGETTVRAYLEDGSAFATCDIIVTGSTNYSLCLKDLSSLAFDSQGYLRRLPIDGKNTVDYINSQFKNNASAISYVNINNVTLSSTDLVGTGTIVSLKNSGNVIDSATVVLTGDVTGDGKIDNRDVAYSARYLVRKQTPNAAQLVAFDVNGDGRVNARDVSVISRYLVGKETISAQ